MKFLTLIFLFVLTFNVYSETVPCENLYPNGKIKDKGNCLKQNNLDIPHGLVESFHKNGLIERSAYYNLGEYDHGIQFIYYPNGILKEKKGNMTYRGYMSLNGIQEGFYPNGNIAYRLNIKPGLLSPKPDGPIEQFDEDGKLWFKANIDKGEYHGLEEHYYRNGELWVLRNYKHGRTYGVTKIFYEDGNIWALQNVKKGKLEGKEERFNRNGKITEISNYKRGLLHGVSTDYWNNGQKRNVVNWKKGSKHGISEHFDRKGKLLLRVKYDNFLLKAQTRDGKFVDFMDFLIEEFELPKDFFLSTSVLDTLKATTIKSSISGLERIIKLQIVNFLESEKLFAMAREDFELVKVFELRIQILKGEDKVNIKEQIDFTLSSIEKRLEFEENTFQLSNTAKDLYLEGFSLWMKNQALISPLEQDINSILSFVKKIGDSKEPMDLGVGGMGLRSTRQHLERILKIQEEVPEFLSIAEIAFISMFVFLESRELVLKSTLSSEF